MIEERNEAARAPRSSLRTRSREETLRIAREVAPRLGITRVTDITRLDRVGIPVSTSIRPGAHHASLCVCAGKGLTWADAHVGAYMEAIELAMAEPGRSHVEVVRASARRVLDGRPESLLSLCPRFQSRIVLDAPTDCIRAVDIVSGAEALLPADLILHPGPSLADPDAPFMSSTNGLASGNDVLEATVHGLAELIERDIYSFSFFQDRSRLVDPDTLPEVARSLRRTIEASGLVLHTRCLDNVFGLPFFSAVVADPIAGTPLFVNGGSGLHPHREIAIVRAITEAVQSRLSFIHGGRDDLTAEYRYYKDFSRSERAERAERLIAAAAGGSTIDYRAIPDHSTDAPALEDCLRVMTDALAGQGMRRVYRVTLTRPDDLLHVVKLVVPGLEFWDDRSRRLGPRLRDFIESLQSDHLRGTDTVCAARSALADPE